MTFPHFQRAFILLWFKTNDIRSLEPPEKRIALLRIIIQNRENSKREYGKIVMNVAEMNLAKNEYCHEES